MQLRLYIVSFLFSHGKKTKLLAIKPGTHQTHLAADFKGPLTIIIQVNVSVLIN